MSCATSIPPHLTKNNEEVQFLKRLLSDSAKIGNVQAWTSTYSSDSLFQKYRRNNFKTCYNILLNGLSIEHLQRAETPPLSSIPGARPVHDEEPPTLSPTMSEQKASSSSSQCDSREYTSDDGSSENSDMEEGSAENGEVVSKTLCENKVKKIEGPCAEKGEEKDDYDDVDNENDVDGEDDEEEGDDKDLGNLEEQIADDIQEREIDGDDNGADEDQAHINVLDDKITEGDENNEEFQSEESVEAELDSEVEEVVQVHPHSAEAVNTTAPGALVGNTEEIRNDAADATVPYIYTNGTSQGHEMDIDDSTGSGSAQEVEDGLVNEGTGRESDHSKMKGGHTNVDTTYVFTNGVSGHQSSDSSSESNDVNAVTAGQVRDHSAITSNPQEQGQKQDDVDPADKNDDMEDDSDDAPEELATSAAQEMASAASRAERAAASRVATARRERRRQQNVSQAPKEDKVPNSDISDVRLSPTAIAEEERTAIVVAQAREEEELEASRRQLTRYVERRPNRSRVVNGVQVALVGRTSDTVTRRRGPHASAASFFARHVYHGRVTRVPSRIAMQSRARARRR